MQDLQLNHMPAPPIRRDWRIGAIGSGFIMRDVHLVAYKKLGLSVQAITGTPLESAREVASARGIDRVYDSYAELIADPSIEVLDIAVPPHVQPQVIAEAIRNAGHVRGILAQKPLAMNYRDALALVEGCEQAGIVLAVNQNMRYDQSIRALKTLLERGDLGEPVLATIEMRAIPHWQTWLRDYPGLTLAGDEYSSPRLLRFLFGDPEFVFASARTDPRTQFPHRDGIVLYILEYANGLRASSWDDVWAGRRVKAQPRTTTSSGVSRVQTDLHRVRSDGQLSKRGAEHDPICDETEPGCVDHPPVERSLVPRCVPGHDGRTAGQPDRKTDPEDRRSRKPWHHGTRGCLLSLAR